MMISLSRVSFKNKNVLHEFISKLKNKFFVQKNHIIITQTNISETFSKKKTITTINHSLSNQINVN